MATDGREIKGREIASSGSVRRIDEHTYLVKSQSGSIADRNAQLEKKVAGLQQTVDNISRRYKWRGKDEAEK